MVNKCSVCYIVLKYGDIIYIILTMAYFIMKKLMMCIIIQTSTLNSIR